MQNKELIHFNINIHKFNSELLGSIQYFFSYIVNTIGSIQLRVHRFNSNKFNINRFSTYYYRTTH